MLGECIMGILGAKTSLAIAMVMVISSITALGAVNDGAKEEAVAVSSESSEAIETTVTYRIYDMFQDPLMEFWTMALKHAMYIVLVGTSAGRAKEAMKSISSQ